MTQWRPSRFKKNKIITKTKLRTQDKSTGNGIRSLWGKMGGWMTHDRPSKTRRGHARTYHFTTVRRFLGSGILLARRWKQKMADNSCRQFRTVLNINTSHTLNSVMLEWACLNKKWNKLGYIFMLIGVNSTSGRASGYLQSSRVGRRSSRMEQL